jgi:transcription antitermination factor NusG
LVHQPDASEYVEPAVIADSFIAGLQGCCLRHPRTEVWRLKLGTQVRILRGPFAGFEGTIASWSSGDRCQLVLWLLNRDVPVEVSAADITATAEVPSRPPEPPRSAQA